MYPYFIQKKKFFPGLALLALLSMGCHSKSGSENTWSVYKADKESSSYSPLKQINTENVGQLQLAWTFTPNDAPEGANFSRSECNPIVVNGILYASSARHRIYAVNAASGEKLWSFDPFDGGPGGGVNRGLTYWEDGEDQRILFTAGHWLYALDAHTGALEQNFGSGGKVSMNEGMRGDPEAISVIPTSPGIIFDDLLIMGTEVSELYGAEPGYIRAYNVKTGALVWTFHTIPKPGEVGYETWPKDAYKYVGGANNWGGMSVDEKRGMVFLSTGSPTYDYYGADRPGQNLFGNSVVALNARTGAYIWHYQTVHHDLWDYDLPAPPNLVTVERNGELMDAVAQTSKVGFLYVFDRDTGKPLFPIEERPVPKSLVPGEQAWPTQPFPLKPAPYAKQTFSEEDLANYSPGSHDSLLQEFRSYRYEGLFTPPDTRGTFMYPGSRGGSSWGGGAFDPENHVLYVKSNNSPEISLLKKIKPEQSNSNSSPYEVGKTFYGTYCINCHGADKKGHAPDYPSLTALNVKMGKEQVLAKIRSGGGKMPSFASVLAGKEEGIIAFLFEQRDRAARREQNLLKEVASNEGANSDKVKDTLSRYLNLKAYGYFRDAKGRPGIKPPWGTLHAINLNTGDYEWSVPVGNEEALQEKGQPITGTESSVGPVVTAGGLVFLAGTHDHKLYVFDKATGKTLWERNLPSVATGSPSIYYYKGKEYVAFSVAGNDEQPSGSIMAFALP